MIGASLYIIACSTRNRVSRWVKRLREPRYLVAALAGAAYFIFVLNTQSRVRSRSQSQRSRNGPLPSQALADTFAAFAAAGPVAAGFALLAVSAASWLFRVKGALLDFSRAEAQFLFPAPVSSRMLIVYRMLRSQLGLLIGPLVFAIVSPLGSAPVRIRMAITMWILFFSMRAYVSVVALARVQLTSPDESRRRIARLPLLLILGGLIAVASTLGRALLGAPIVDVNDALTRVAAVSAHGLPHLALWPFVALVAPMFAADWMAFLRSLPSALLVLVALVGLLLVNDRAFDDLTREVADERRDQPERKKAAYRARKVGWTLAPTGRAEPAFAWKALLQTLRIVEIRVLVRLAIFVLWMAGVASISSRGISASLGVFTMIGVAISTMLGPLLLRVDLRQDLQHLELLKTWPVRAAELVRGEMLFPAAMLSAIVWSLTGLGLYLSTAVFPSSSLVLRASSAAAVCLVAPALIAAQFAIHNAAALVFPAWVGSGWRARGVDAVGQRLIVMGGTTILVALAAVPGALLGGVVWFAFDRFIGPVVLVPAAAVCAATIGVEVLLATEALGPAYERLDLMAIERTE